MSKPAVGIRGQLSAIPKVVVATTVALTFISFWRAAAVVLSDLASSAFYAGGIAEHAVGKSAPWFILGVMLFSFAVRSVYLESLQHVRARRRVCRGARCHESFHGAALGIRADLRLHLDRTHQRGQRRPVPGPPAERDHQSMAHIGHAIGPNLFSAIFGVAVTLYFWWNNIKGIHESSGKALRIMQITTVMVVAFLIWCPITHADPRPRSNSAGARCPAIWNSAPKPWAGCMGQFGRRSARSPIIVAFGHALLSMSGFETLAQVYREIAYPKLKNLKSRETSFAFTRYSARAWSRCSPA